MLVKDCGENTHRDFELRLFNNPNGVSNNDNDWPIRFILSSYYHTYGPNGIPGIRSFLFAYIITPRELQLKKH